jgi:hypothetical protein
MHTKKGAILTLEENDILRRSYFKELIKISYSEKFMEINSTTCGHVYSFKRKNYGHVETVSINSLKQSRVFASR